jgi:GNAT superfamily N-acetyltransferase
MGAGAGREYHKVVTVLFCDVASSTALGESVDPEVLRALLSRYFDEMKAIVERHRGTVEKFIGDAVVAVFGVPQLHEDDALRGVRAAVEMRDALPELGVEARIGLNTGEVVVGTEERLATGDAVNVADGIATRLTRAAEEWARARGWSSISLSVSEKGNAAARLLYAKLGYVDARADLSECLARSCCGGAPSTWPTHSSTSPRNSEAHATS